MGKRYESEIAALPDTYRWALAADVSTFARALSRTIDRPLIVVGSGGSLTAAHIIAALHEQYTGLLARALTPLDVVGTARRLDRASVLFVSAGGSNPDVVDAFNLVVEQEPHATIVLSGRESSALATATHPYRGVDFVGIPLPVVKDGYLATNSLLSFAVLAWRAYSRVFNLPDSVPPTLNDLVGADFQTYRAHIATACSPVWGRSSLVLLHGADTAPAAVDFESRFVEAALGHANIADFRNFAHGRHQWIARYEEDVAMITLETKRDASLGHSTTTLIPASIPVARLSVVGKGAHASIGAVVTVMILAAEAGIARGADPGRPKVPQFGRRLYRARGLRTVVVSPARTVTGSGRIATRSWAGTRKRRMTNAGIALSDEPNSNTCGEDAWDTLANQAAERLMAARYGGIVFDYDGTLCDTSDRYRGVSSDVIGGVNAILARRLPIGIATGRGRSVHAALRASIPSLHWEHILVGYYNGADVRSLSSDAPDMDGEIVNSDLTAARDALASDSRITTQCLLTVRRTQLTLELAAGARESELWDIVSEVVAGATALRLSVVRSSHSIDVLAPDVTKLSVVRSIAERTHDEILRIGDRGKFPGNDFELLATPYGLSVDEVSGAHAQCWNLAPPGVTGVAATAYYLSQLSFRRRTFRLVGL